MVLARHRNQVSNYPHSFGGRRKSGKYLKAVPYTKHVYAWKPFEPDFHAKAQQAFFKKKH